jgi:diaminohydroxyphosphoribosylaminopyrimidine deaminase/5-amino-6-(5-phosphoribosylamino)uracil reductase
MPATTIDASPDAGPDASPDAGRDAGPDAGPDAGQQWSEVPHLIRSGKSLTEPWESLFGALRGTANGRPMAVGQIGQSLDGRIATLSGHSRYINGPHGLAHLHRLRALVDAVVVGACTVRVDDPQLTVREVAGPNPVRVVIDPRGTLAATSRAFRRDGVHRIVITRQQVRPKVRDDIETIALPDTAGWIAPDAILDALFERGLRRILIEGGAKTVSSFLSAGCLDRLHVVVAPMIMGSGKAGLDLPPIADMTGALRVPIRTHSLGNEILFDCDLSAQRRCA